eukprot:scaffold121595_cov29-Tisochrysis_lutea.AAC.4
MFPIRAGAWPGVSSSSSTMRPSCHSGGASAVGGWMFESAALKSACRICAASARIWATAADSGSDALPPAAQ